MTALPAVCAGDLDRLQDRHAGADRAGEGPRPARERDLLDDVADLRRQAQLEAVPGQAARARSSSSARTRSARASDDRDHDVPGAGHGVGDADGDLGRQRQRRRRSPFSLEISSKMPTKTGTTKATTTTITTSAIAEDDGRIHHRRLDLALEGVELLELDGDAVERLLEAAGALAGRDHRAVERGEDAGLALHRRVQRAARLDVGAQRGDRRLQHRVLGLVLERVERAQHRHAR